MDEIIKQHCKKSGVPFEILTPEEIEDLREEIKAEQRGMCILDGVLANPDLYSREMEWMELQMRKKCEENGVSFDDLTPEDIERLWKEIRA